MRSTCRRMFKAILAGGYLAGQLCSAQLTPNAPTVAPGHSERWNLFYQATSIGSTHGAFPSRYSGPFSLQSRREADVSLTSTLFLGLRANHNTQIYLNPEIAGGRGF